MLDSLRRVEAIRSTVAMSASIHAYAPGFRGGDSNDSSPSLSLGMLRTKKIVSTAFKPVMHKKDVRHPQSAPIRVSAGMPVA